MALDPTTLQSAIKTAFEKAKNTPAPSDPTKSDQTQETILATLSQDLAAAIDAYVKGASVINVKVQVTDPTQKPIGVGQQTPQLGFGNLQ